LWFRGIQKMNRKDAKAQSKVNLELQKVLLKSPLRLCASAVKISQSNFD